MSHELNLRQKAMRLKQAGRAVSWIGQHLERSREWFYKWWNRYLEEGPAGLRDRSHAPKTIRADGRRRLVKPSFRFATD